MEEVSIFCLEFIGYDQNSERKLWVLNLSTSELDYVEESFDYILPEDSQVKLTKFIKTVDDKNIFEPILTFQIDDNDTRMRFLTDIQSKIHDKEYINEFIKYMLD